MTEIFQRDKNVRTTFHPYCHTKLLFFSVHIIIVISIFYLASKTQFSRTMSARTNYVIVVAHGGPQPNAASISNIKIITKAETPLLFADAIACFKNTKKFPEYASAGLGHFAGLSDAECKLLFGSVPQGEGFVDTGLKVPSGTYTGAPVWCLNGDKQEKALTDIYLEWKDSTIILCACRSGTGPLPPIEPIKSSAMGLHRTVFTHAMEPTPRRQVEEALIFMTSADPKGDHDEILRALQHMVNCGPQNVPLATTTPAAKLSLISPPETSKTWK